MSLHWWKEVPSWFVVLLSFVICSQLSHGHSCLDIQWIHLLHRGRNFQGQRMFKWVLLGTLGGLGVGEEVVERGVTFWHPHQWGVTALHVEPPVTGVTEQHVLLNAHTHTYTHSKNLVTPCRHVYIVDISTICIFPPNQNCTVLGRSEERENHLQQLSKIVMFVEKQ